MKYKNKSELGTMVTDLGNSVSAIRAANEKLLKDLQHLDGPDGRKYKPSELAVLKAELRSNAAASMHRDFIGLRKTIEQETRFWKAEFFAHVPLHFPNSIADEMTERLWLSRKYELLSPARFKAEVAQASADGRAAELHVARLVLESRGWSSEEEMRDISTALHLAERDVQYTERSESLELLDVASELIEDAVSSYESLSKGGQDVRLKMSDAAKERFKNVADIQANREKLQGEHGTIFQL
jgi:hypothetical protein